MARPSAPAPPPLGQQLSEPDQIQAFLDEVSRRKQPLAALLSEADLSLQDGQLHVATAPDDGMLEMRLQQPSNRQIVEDAIASVWGAGFGWRLVRGGSRKTSSPSAAVAPAAGETAGVAEIPQVQAVLDIFGGRVEKIEEHGRSREE